MLVSLTALSHAFSTVSTPVDHGQLTQQVPPSNGTDNLFQQIEEFLASSGYEQAREDPSYAINIPFSELVFTI